MKILKLTNMINVAIRKQEMIETYVLILPHYSYVLIIFKMKNLLKNNIKFNELLYFFMKNNYNYLKTDNEFILKKTINCNTLMKINLNKKYMYSRYVFNLP